MKWRFLYVLFVLTGFFIVPAGGLRLLREGAATQARLDRMLILAIRRDDTEAVLDLLRQGANANAQAEASENLVSWQDVFARSHEETSASQAPTALFVEKGVWREEGIEFCSYGNAGVVKALLEHGADANRRDPRGRTVLMLAALHQERPIIAALLAHGADINARDAGGSTALSFAEEGDAKRDAESGPTTDMLKRAGAVE